jgi:hypothetical protein
MVDQVDARPERRDKAIEPTLQRLKPDNIATGWNIDQDTFTRFAQNQWQARAFHMVGDDNMGDKTGLHHIQCDFRRGDLTSIEAFRERKGSNWVVEAM